MTLTAEPRQVPRFLCDEMLRGLGRWLRAAGYDTVIAAGGLPDRALAARCAVETVDILLLPTVGTIYEMAEIAAEPLRLNANLGLYTNFANLLDLAAIALPAGFTKAGLPLGFSLIAPAFADRALLDLGMRCQELAGLPLGAGALSLQLPRDRLKPRFQDSSAD